MNIISPFFFGFLAAFGALFAELFAFSFIGEGSAMQNGLTADTDFVFAIGGFGFLLLSAFIEESFKRFVLGRTFSPEESFRAKTLFLLFFALGFAAMEALLFVLGKSAGDTVSVVTHMTGIFLLHLATVMLIGRSISRDLSSIRAAIFIVAVATAVHFLYNVFVFYQAALRV